MKTRVTGFLFSVLIAFAGQSASAAEGRAKVDYLGAIDMMNLTITGAAAKQVYSQLIQWGYQVQTCPKVKNFDGVYGPGLGCSRKRRPRSITKIRMPYSIPPSLASKKACWKKS